MFISAIYFTSEISQLNSIVCRYGPACQYDFSIAPAPLHYSTTPLHQREEITGRASQAATTNVQKENE